MIFFVFRRAVTILLCAGSFWLGMKTNSAFNLSAISVGDPDCEVVQ
jgi:hypothetical protein